MEILVPKLSREEMETIYTMINTVIKKHLTEGEYHTHFLKDGTH